MAKYDGSERLEKMRVWRPGKIENGKRVKGHWRQVVASALGKEVADILGQVWKGLYHLDEDKIDWENDRYIEVNMVEDLSTWDFNRLTELVVLCHDRAIRMSINKCNFSCLKLIFHKRSRTGDITQRHPKMEEAIELIRSAIGLEIVDDQESDCELFSKGEPDGDCLSNGWYRCVECEHFDVGGSRNRGYREEDQ
jgi:hypothetical protein